MSKKKQCVAQYHHIPIYRFQIFSKFLIILILCLWIILEMFHFSNDIDGINSLSWHLISSPKPIRTMYISLLCVVFIVFCIVYIWLPSYFMPTSYTISMTVFALFLFFFFLDLFLSYTSNTQFFKYHNKLFLVLALFIISLCWYHIPQRQTIHAVIIAVILVTTMAFFGRFHYLMLSSIDDIDNIAQHFRMYGICQFFFLCLLVSVLPMAYNARHRMKT